MCQKTVPKATNQRTDRAHHENAKGPSGRDDVQNPNLQMGFVNRPVSMEMDSDTQDTEGYTRLHRPFDGYEKLQKPPNPVGETHDYSEYMVPVDQSAVYEGIYDSRRN